MLPSSLVDQSVEQQTTKPGGCGLAYTKVRDFFHLPRASAKWEIYGFIKHLNVNYTVSFMIHTLNAHSFQIPLTRGVFVFLLPFQTFFLELFPFVSMFLCTGLFLSELLV